MKKISTTLRNDKYQLEKFARHRDLAIKFSKDDIELKIHF